MAAQATVKISLVEMDAAREAAQLHSRSVSAQVEHWIRLGRAVERDQRFGFAQVEEALRGLRSPDELSASQQEDYFDRLGDEMFVATPEQRAFFADRRKRGVGVGLDEAGQLVYQSPTH